MSAGRSPHPTSKAFRRPASGTGPIKKAGVANKKEAAPNKAVCHVHAGKVRQDWRMGRGPGRISYTSVLRAGEWQAASEVSVAVCQMNLVWCRGQTTGTYGQTIGTHGQTIGTYGQTIGAHGQTIGTYGQTIGTYGQTIGTYGLWRSVTSTCFSGSLLGSGPNLQGVAFSTTSPSPIPPPRDIPPPYLSSIIPWISICSCFP